MHLSYYLTLWTSRKKGKFEITNKEVKKNVRYLLEIESSVQDIKRPKVINIIYLNVCV